MSDKDIETKFYQSLGKFVAKFAFLDYLIRKSYWMIACKSPTQTERDIPDQFGNVIDNLRRDISSAYSPELKEEILQILTKAKDLNKIRRKIVHSSWWQSEHTPEFFSALRIDRRIENEFGGEWEEYTAEDINAFTLQIIDLNKHIFYTALKWTNVALTQNIEGVYRLK